MTLRRYQFFASIRRKGATGAEVALDVPDNLSGSALDRFVRGELRKWADETIELTYSPALIESEAEATVAMIEQAKLAAWIESVQAWQKPAQEVAA